MVYGKFHRQHIISQPIKSSAIDLHALDELGLDNSHWQDKARSLQARRWRKIKHQTL